MLIFLKNRMVRIRRVFKWIRFILKLFLMGSEVKKLVLWSEYIND